MGRKRKKQLRPIHAMLACWFCGGRVVPLAGETVAGRGRNITAYRCEAEGVRWDASENLVIYEPFEGGSLPGRTLKSTPS